MSFSWSITPPLLPESPSWSSSIWNENYLKKYLIFHTVDFISLFFFFFFFFFDIHLGTVVSPEVSKLNLILASRHRRPHFHRIHLLLDFFRWAVHLHLPHLYGKLEIQLLSKYNYLGAIWGKRKYPTYIEFLYYLLTYRKYGISGRTLIVAALK